MSKNCSPNHIIKTFLFPKSVAVFGASKNPLKGGNRIVNNLVYNKFEGEKNFIILIFKKPISLEI